MWRFRGSPHYIDQQGDRLGVSKILTDQARHNQEMYRVSVLVGQLCERYYRTPKDGGRAIVFPAELAQVQGTLGQCEQELEKLHVLAAAAQAIIDEAHRAFGIAPPSRQFPGPLQLRRPGRCGRTRPRRGTFHPGLPW